MRQVLGLHEVELRPGVDPAEYERVFAEEIAASTAPPGVNVRLLKGERGVRSGKYLILMELDDVETRDRYFPQPGEESDELGRFMEQHPDTARAWRNATALALGHGTVTDYVVVVD